MTAFRTFCLGMFIALNALRSPAEPPAITLQTKRTWNFAEDGVRFTNDFVGARLNECERIGPLEYRLTLAPENAPINPSPWYAFQVTSSKPQKIKLRFNVTAKGSVLRPRLSHDGHTWKVIEAADFTAAPKSLDDAGPERAVATIDVGPDVLWVAGQEMIGLAELGAWTAAMAKRPFMRMSVIGESIEHRPLWQLVMAETDRPNYVFIISRQHPPEITGSLALMQFVDTLANESDLSQRYRKAFQTVIVPLMNPDGVVHGHWRHNLGGVDLNRDWRAFSQPETRAARDAMLKLGKAPDAKVFLFLDFHSTGMDIFYGQPDSTETYPPHFEAKWLGAFAARFPNYHFERDDAHNVGAATSKSWANETFGCPGITYELGYNTDRELIKELSTGAAEEMMKLLLEEKGKP